MFQNAEHFLDICSFPFMKYAPKYNMYMIFFEEIESKGKEGTLS